MKHIRMFDYLEHYNEIFEEIDEAIKEVLSSGVLILGPKVEQFEKDFTSYLGGTGSCVGVNSGTDALEVALRALNIGQADEVITVSNTAVPTVSAIRSVGATPVFCDIVPSTCLMDLEQVPRLITNKTRAVIPVHLFGNVVDVLGLREIINNNNIKIIEDCAQAQGAKFNGVHVGTMGEIGCYSFYPTKNLGAYGDGGLCYSHDESLVREMRKIRMYGFEDSYYSVREGINTRLDEIQAAILLVKLKYLDRQINRRRAIAEHYRSQLGPNIELLEINEDVEHAYHLFVVKVNNREKIRSKLASLNIDTGIHYPTPIHLMNGYNFLGYKMGSLPVTEEVSKSILSLPMYPELSIEAVERVCAELNSASE